MLPLAEECEECFIVKGFDGGEFKFKKMALATEIQCI